MDTTTLVDDTQSCLEIACGYEAMAKEVERAIRREELILAEACSFTIVIDKPPGFALKVLLQCPREGKVVVTDNPCPEYWEDLWDLKPQALLAGGHSIKELIDALERAAKGERFRRVPHSESELTPRERDILRLCAMSYTNRQIAEQLSLKDPTIKNNLNSIFSKLGLEHRGQVILYYWGMWDWIEPQLSGSCT